MIDSYNLTWIKTKEIAIGCLKTYCIANYAVAGLYDVMPADSYCGRPWQAVYINFNENIHQIQVLTTPLCPAQAIFYSLPKNKWGTKYRGLTYSAKSTICEICRATYSARQAYFRI